MRLDAVAKQRPGAAAGPVCQPARDKGKEGGGREQQEEGQSEKGAALRAGALMLGLRAAITDTE